MGYTLQYQAHVDDLTSLAGRPKDTSWFHVPPHEVPKALTLAPEDFFATDLTSGAAAAVDDQSWLVQYPSADEPSQPSSLNPEYEGFHAGDLESAGGRPGDVSWFVTLADEAPIEPEVPPVGFFAGDVHSGAAVEPAWTRVSRAETFNANETDATEFTFQADLVAVTGIVYARVFDETATQAVSGSQVSTTTTSDFVLVRSATFALVDGHDYYMQGGSIAADEGQVIGGQIDEA